MTDDQTSATSVQWFPLLRLFSWLLALLVLGMFSSIAWSDLSDHLSSYQRHLDKLETSSSNVLRDLRASRSASENNATITPGDGTAAGKADNATD